MLNKKTIGEALRSLKDMLTLQKFENPSLEARLLVSMATGARMEDFITNEQDNLTPAQLEKINDVTQRRLSGEPIARIAGVKEFWGLEFELSPATLIPRPDTETLVEAVLRYTKNDVIPAKAGISKNKSQDPRLREDDIKILDLGTGTGCIPIALLTELPKAHATAVDISAEALQTAKRNAERHGVRDRFATVQSNWFEKIDSQFDIIISNPPYIESSAIESLQIEVRNHDPILALDGGESGFEAYKIILRDAKKYLTAHGRIFLEVGQGQVNGIAGIVESVGATLVSTHADLAGIERVVEIAYGDK